MKNIYKIIIFLGFVATTLFPFSGNAQVVHYSSLRQSLLNQIVELVKIVESLQNQLTLLLQDQDELFVFTRDLEMGDSGREVYMLQRVLNKHFLTQVADTGLGSVGNETEYFGLATKNALEIFQTTYADKILYPQGYYVATGKVDELTREMLNKVYIEQKNGSNEGYNQGVLSAKPVINSISPSTGKNGTTVTITGLNFGSFVDIYSTIGNFMNVSTFENGTKASITLYSEMFAELNQTISEDVVDDGSDDIVPTLDDYATESPYAFPVAITVETSSGQSDPVLFSMNP